MAFLLFPDGGQMDIFNNPLLKTQTPAKTAINTLRISFSIVLVVPVFRIITGAREQLQSPPLLYNYRQLRRLACFVATAFYF
ncbi:MAG TPA: hypothetical protein VEY10_05200 [Flavisolibacter sp.]|nr:hypothetical protein [Flavisolibacter sp.]